MPTELWLSIVPPLAAIVMAIWTKQVIPSLLVGLWIGSLLYTGGIVESLNQTISYISGVLTDTGNLDVLLFLYAFSGMVALIQVSGGVQAFASLISKYIKGPNQTLLISWALLPITFMDCGFRVVAGGAIINPLAKRFNVAKERLAYMLNNSSSPVIVLIPMATTFIGYTTGVISKGMEAANIGGAPITLFLRSLPFHFFSYVSILIALLSLMPAFNFSRMKNLMKQNDGHKEKPQTKKSKQNHKYAFEFSEEMDGDKEHQEKADTAKDQMGVAMKGKEDHMKGMKMGMENEEPALKPRLLNLAVPILILIPLSFILMWESENPSRMMLSALILTIVASVGLYLLQGLKLKTIMDRFIKGGNKLMTTIIILVLAWPISDVSQDLGLTRLIEGTLAGTIKPVWIPLIVFVVTAAVTYFIGSSWGSWALMMPVAIPLAVSTGSSIPLVIAAVFSGGTFGDVTSPVSGMTAMSAGIANADHMKYVRAMTPYNMTAAALSAILFLGASFLFI